MSKRTYKVNADGKAVLTFEKNDYKALSQEDKKTIKKYFLFSRIQSAWVSKGAYILYSVQETIKKLGFEFTEKEEVRSFEERLNNKIERAENRAERFVKYAQNASQRAKQLQSEFNKYRKDWSWLTQPYINSTGGRRFRNHKERVLNNYDKGFEEYRKSDYFRQRAATALSSAEQEQYNDPIYVQRKLKELDKLLQKSAKNLPLLYERIEQMEEGEAKEKRLLNAQFYFDRYKLRNQEKAFLLTKLDELIEQGLKVFDKHSLTGALYVCVYYVGKKRWYKVCRVNQITVAIYGNKNYIQHVKFEVISDAVFKGELFAASLHPNEQGEYIIEKLQNEDMQF